MDQPKRHPDVTRRFTFRAAGVALGVGGLAAMVSFGSAAGAASSHKPKRVVISTTKNAELGTILVSGTTLYTLKASKTPCTAQCLKVWPAVVLPKGVKTATAGAGVSTRKLGTMKRAGGVRQVTYSGKALYWFSGDRTAGQVGGNVTDQWGRWSAFVTVALSTTSTPQPVAPSATTGPSATTAPSATTGPSATTAPSATVPPPSSTPLPATPATSPPSTTPAPTTPPATTPPATTPPPPPTTTTAPSSGGASF